MNKGLESHLLEESQNSKLKLNLYLAEFSKKCDDFILQHSKQIISIDITISKQMDIEKLKISSAVVAVRSGCLSAVAGWGLQTRNNRKCFSIRNRG